MLIAYSSIKAAENPIATNASPVPSPACPLSSGSSWRRCAPCLFSAPNEPMGDIKITGCVLVCASPELFICLKTGNESNTVVTLWWKRTDDRRKRIHKQVRAYLSESTSPDHFEGLEVVQSQPRPLQPQELCLFTGVLRATHDLL